nr:hypothetical protein [Tanacetum cinerariifolium]
TRPPPTRAATSRRRATCTPPKGKLVQWGVARLYPGEQLGRMPSLLLTHHFTTSPHGPSSCWRPPA